MTNVNYRIAGWIAMMLLPCAAFGQEIIKGIVVDSATFSPLPYINVQVKNTTQGVTTDLKGNFGIVATRDDTLIFSIVGYQRLELPLFTYETGVILLPERATQLAPITVIDSYSNPYRGMFEDRPAGLSRRKLPFYYSKSRKDEVKLEWLKDENQRVQTYLDVVVHDSKTKKDLMKKYHLTEKQYYETLTRFNEEHHEVMYFLTSVELVSLLGQFFEREH